MTVENPSASLPGKSEEAPNTSPTDDKKGTKRI
jgi:hypothetical protein